MTQHTRTEMTISGIPIKSLTLLEAIANGFNRSIFYEKGAIPTEVSRRTHFVYKNDGMDIDTEFTTLALTDLPAEDYRNPKAWEGLIKIVQNIEQPIAIALNCEDINFVLFNYPDHFHIQFSDGNVKTQHQDKKYLDKLGKVNNMAVNCDETEVIFGHFSVKIGEESAEKSKDVLPCKSCKHADVSHDLVLRPNGENDKGNIYRCTSTMRWKNDRCLNYEEWS